MCQEVKGSEFRFHYRAGLSLFWFILKMAPFSAFYVYVFSIAAAAKFVSNMEQLPKEVLVEVLKHLPQSDVISATYVNKSLCGVIDEFDLVEHIYVGESNDESFVPNRKYTKATVKSFKPSVHQKVFDAIGGSLKSLRFFHCSLDLIDIVSILRSSPGLKSLTFDYVRIDDEAIPEAVAMPKLHNLNLMFMESDPQIFRVLQKSSVSKLSLNFYGDIPYSNFSECVKLLNSQEGLKSLAISGIYESNLFLIRMEPSKYHLSEFSIDNCDLEEWDRLEGFLMEHVGTLEKFVVKNVEWDPSTILNRCAKLKTLQGHRVKMESIEVAAGVEELSLEPPIRAMDKFPNVKRLFIGRSSPEVNQIITSAMGKVEELEVKFCSIAAIEMPTLKKLKLTSVDGAVPANFFTTHNQIEELSFLWIYNIDDALLEAITTRLSNLRVLRILGDNQLTARAFAIIRDNGKRLKVLEMSKWVQKFQIDDWRCLHQINGLEIYTEKFL